MSLRLGLSFLLLLLLLLFLGEARLNLDPSDLDALSAVRRNLGIDSPSSPSANPCSLPGVVCERRISDTNNSYVLRVTRLVFRSQRLTGTVSLAIGRLSELRELSLSNNLIVDRLPPEIVGCSKLQILDLRNNGFSGKVPSNLSSLVRLRVLDLSSNKFSGDLSFLKHFPDLESLSLADNLFSGEIPRSIRSFRNLHFFNVSGNDFLDGPVPKITRKAQPARSLHPMRYILAENSNSSKRNNSSPAKSHAPAPGPKPAHNKHKKNRRKKVAGWLLGFFVGTVAGAISGIVFSALFKMIVAAIRGGKHTGPTLFGPLIRKAQDLEFLEKDNGLASLERIGEGGCGEVYKAELPGSNGKFIAIKRILQPPKDAAELADEESRQLHKKMRQIRSEINTVGKIRHRNLLPLLAHVQRPDCHYLIYEFMKNGSLQDLLQQVSEGQRELPWPARHKIAQGIAAGLEYLHMYQSPRIIHRDLKPANVLLDDDMEARIADFGLAKAMPDAHTHITTSNVAGTVGYIAPEYHQTLRFTDKCDIYSFGVLLGVLLTGKPPSDKFFQHTEEMSLVKWMRNVMISEDPGRAIDPTLLGQGYDEQMVLALKIACYCTMDDPKERPNSKDVNRMLSQIKP